MTKTSRAALIVAALAAVALTGCNNSAPAARAKRAGVGGVNETLTPPGTKVTKVADINLCAVYRVATPDGRELLVAEGYSPHSVACSVTEVTRGP